MALRVFEIKRAQHYGALPKAPRPKSAAVHQPQVVPDLRLRAMQKSAKGRKYEPCVSQASERACPYGKATVLNTRPEDRATIKSLLQFDYAREYDPRVRPRMQR